MREADATALMPFFSEVETLNRGLDLAQSARERGDQQAIKEEHGRNLLTIRRLLELFSPARGVVDRHR